MKKKAYRQMKTISPSIFVPYSHNIQALLNKCLSQPNPRIVNTTSFTYENSFTFIMPINKSGISPVETHMLVSNASCVAQE